jgi:hypothetical protein
VTRVCGEAIPTSSSSAIAGGRRGVRALQSRKVPRGKEKSSSFSKEPELTLLRRKIVPRCGELL